VVVDTKVEAESVGKVNGTVVLAGLSVSESGVTLKEAVEDAAASQSVADPVTVDT
jgi:hypothetical protein